ncbi:uncharacterized protein LOC132746142 [Ruditapes philippinarum]|uniref:uncharacterized protein LOC132746142 n=1 Tax=Ruditapes philippinarum TaxID=129788 RepID=UPI00295B5A15|nr:uncharacterized protein LOC132746142 [Ruditapes philippinarum]
MGYRQISALFRTGIIFLSVSLVIQLLVITLPYWYFKEFSESVSVNGGLLFACAKIGHNKQCGTIENPQDWYARTRDIELIAFLMLVTALIICMIFLFVRDMKILKLVNWILCFSSCGFIIIGVTIYKTKSRDYLSDISSAFTLAIISGIAALVAGVVCLMDWIKQSFV